MLFATLIMMLLVKTRNEAMFASMCRKAHIIAEGNIIGRSPHHLPEMANIILMMYLLRKNDVIRYAHNDVARQDSQ